MKLSIRWMLVLAAGWGALANARATRADHPVGEFCPWEVGTEWIYSAAGQTITEKLAGFELLDGEQCAKIETLVNGKVVAVEHLAQRKDGLYRVAVAGERLVPALCYLKFPAQDGQQWDVQSEIQGQKITGRFTIGEQRVQVPAGEYHVLSVNGEDFHAGEAQLSFRYAFAPKVGKVQQVITSGDREMVLSLKEFRPASKTVTK